MAEEVISQTSDLDKGSSDTQVDRDTTVTDVDVGQAERIRANTTSYDHAKQQEDLEGERRDRTTYDQLLQQTMRQNDQLHAVVLQGLQNMVNANNMAQNQERRHVDHTLIDLHGSDVNPGASPNEGGGGAA